MSTIDEFGKQPQVKESLQLKRLKERRDALVEAVREKLDEKDFEELWEIDIPNYAERIRAEYKDHASDVEAWYFFGGTPKETMFFADFPEPYSVAKLMSDLENKWYRRIAEKS